MGNDNKQTQMEKNNSSEFAQYVCLSDFKHMQSRNSNFADLMLNTIALEGSTFFKCK